MNVIKKAALSMTPVLLVLESPHVHAGHGRQGYGGFCRGDFIGILGVLTLIGLIVTLILAYKKSGSRKKTLLWHKNIAIITVVMATLHMVFALFFH